MKKTDDTTDLEKDDLLPEYDFQSMTIVARGPGRRPVEHPTVQLEPDVATEFPDSDSVNKALRMLLLARKQAAQH